MGIFNRKKKEDQKPQAKITLDGQEPKKERFNSNISLYEFEKVDWSEFGGI